MKLALKIASLLAVLSGISCSSDEKITVDLDNVVAIRVPYDTLLANSSDGTLKIEAFGLIVKPDTGVRVNRGYLLSKSEVFFSLDSTEQQLNNTDLVWIISNNSLKFENGKFKIRSAGEVTVQAALRSVVSNPILVIISADPNYKAPGLLLDPPATVITISENYLITGKVEYGALLSAGETSISYNSKGRFTYEGAGLSFGETVVSLKAAHPKDPELVTTRSKTVRYLDAASARSLTGDWIGESLGRSFEFTISYVPAEESYTISGQLDLEFQGFGLVQDVALVGIINKYGQIDTRLSKSLGGIEIRGKLEGFFETTGTAQGAYEARLSDGLISFKLVDQKWVAEKL